MGFGKNLTFIQANYVYIIYIICFSTSGTWDFIVAIVVTFTANNRWLKINILEILLTVNRLLWLVIISYNSVALCVPSNVFHCNVFHWCFTLINMFSLNKEHFFHPTVHHGPQPSCSNNRVELRGAGTLCSKVLMIIEWNTERPTGQEPLICTHLPGWPYLHMMASHSGPRFGGCTYKDRKILSHVLKVT